MKPLIFAIDVDGVVADTHTEILRRYNKDWEDSLTIDDITKWELPEIVKPECGEKVTYYFLHHDLYNFIKPIDGALEAIKKIKKEGNTVIFVTSCYIDTGAPKIRWLINHGFTNSHKDVIICDDKSLIKASILIDDRPKYLEEFDGLTVAFDRPYNRHVKSSFRISGWKDNLVDEMSRWYKTRGILERINPNT